MHIHILSTVDIFTPMQPTQDHNVGINLYYIFCMETGQSGKATSVDPNQTLRSWSGFIFLEYLFPLLSSFIFVWKT